MAKNTQGSGSAPKTAQKKNNSGKEASPLRAYTFLCSVDWYPEDSWRKIRVLSSETLYDFGTEVLIAFDSERYHLWDISYRRKEYSIPEASDGFWEDEREQADSVTLGELNLRVGSKLHLAYDYGTTWEFSMKVVANELLKPGGEAESSFPQLIESHGPAMVDDVHPAEVYEELEAQKTGTSERLSEDEEDWDEDMLAGWRYDAPLSESAKSIFDTSQLKEV